MASRSSVIAIDDTIANATSTTSKAIPDRGVAASSVVRRSASKRTTRSVVPQ